MTTNELITRRAKHFGAGDRPGEWLFAADVACCVERGRPGPKIVSRERNSKISASEFAELGGTSAARVLRHLDAWDTAARRGMVPPAADLTPGDTPPLPPADTWPDYYPPVQLTHTAPERQAAIRAQAARDGLSPNTVAQVVNTPAAVASAIKADPAIARVADEALAERARTELSGTPARREPRPSAQETFWTALRYLIAMRRDAAEFARAVQAGDTAFTDTERDAARESIRYVRAGLDLAESLIDHGGVTDAALAAFIDGGRDAR